MLLHKFYKAMLTTPSSVESGNRYFHVSCINPGYATNTNYWYSLMSNMKSEAKFYGHLKLQQSRKML